MRRVIAAAAATAVLALASPVLVATAASAETIPATTSCSNPFTGAQPGPSSFTFTVPATIHPGDTVPIQLSFAVANNSGFDITDINSFAMPDALPVALSAGSRLAGRSTRRARADHPGDLHFHLGTAVRHPDGHATTDTDAGSGRHPAGAFGTCVWNELDTVHLGHHVALR